jgi:putative ABC transport system permease protein
MFLAVGLFTCAATLSGTLNVVRKAAALPPAEAMREQSPERYRVSPLEKLRLWNVLSQPSRMILRHLQRKPVKTLLSLLGLAMASAIMMVGNFQEDAVEFMMHVQFKMAQKQDIEVTLYEPVAGHTLSSMRGLPGVYYAEGQRTVSIKLHHEHMSYRTTLRGVPDASRLYSVLDENLEPVVMPERGLMVTEHLAKKLGFTTGDQVMVEILEGRKRSRMAVIANVSQQYLGLGAYTSLANLNRLMGEGAAIDTVLLKIDPGFEDEIYRRLKEMPVVAGINVRQSVIDSFYQTLQQVLLVFTFINAMLGGVIAFGVVYNTARIALEERGRELASMRVLGYTQAEVAYILLGELALLTLLSIPIGFMLGAGLCQILVNNMQSDLYRVPLVLSAYTFSFSALVVLLSALVSSVFVWNRLKKLDLVEVLKTRE